MLTIEIYQNGSATIVIPPVGVSIIPLPPPATQSDWHRTDKKLAWMIKLIRILLNAADVDCVQILEAMIAWTYVPGEQLPVLTSHDK